MKVADFNLSKLLRDSGLGTLNTATQGANNPRWLAPELLSRDCPATASQRGLFLRSRYVGDTDMAGTLDGRAGLEHRPTGHERRKAPSSSTGGPPPQQADGVPVRVRGFDGEMLDPRPQQETDIRSHYTRTFEDSDCFRLRSRE